ncbi:hypothetical protein [Oculatella sp. LEGE 06141]|uniref:hypothetical protein n=1 Tax=Oculatella sp. LEGE 06141 TaxID=1828648 RepID=UPI0030DCD9FC
MAIAKLGSELHINSLNWVAAAAQTLFGKLPLSCIERSPPLPELLKEGFGNGFTVQPH